MQRTAPFCRIRTVLYQTTQKKSSAFTRYLRFFVKIVIHLVGAKPYFAAGKYNLPAAFFGLPLLFAAKLFLRRGIIFYPHALGSSQLSCEAKSGSAVVLSAAERTSQRPHLFIWNINSGQFAARSLKTQCASKAETIWFISLPNTSITSKRTVQSISLPEK